MSLMVFLEDRAPRRHVIADLSKEKLKWHRSHAITLLYGWSRLVANKDASLLYATLVDFAMPPDVENTR